MKFIPLLFLTLCLSYHSAQAAKLPRALTEADRTRTTEILSFGSMMKLLSNPYPLGGFDGLEIGLASEYIPLEDLAKLGDKTGDEGQLNYQTLTIGKGLFYNVDAFLEFSPMPKSDGLSTFGAQIRWGFYEANFFPFSLSMVLNGGGSSYASLVNSSTLGGDLVGSVSMKDVALYFGVGQGRTVTTFIGAGKDVNGVVVSSAITDDGLTHKVNLTENHAFFGVHFKLDKFFIALEADRYVESNYSGKIGARF